MVVGTSSLKSMSFPAMALDEFYGIRHELPPNEWFLSLIRQLLVIPKTDHVLLVDCYCSSQYLQIDKDNFYTIFRFILLFIYGGIAWYSHTSHTFMCVYGCPQMPEEGFF